MNTRLPLYGNPLHQLVTGSTWRAAWFLLAYLVWGWLLWAAVFAATLTAILGAPAELDEPFFGRAPALVTR